MKSVEEIQQPWLEGDPEPAQDADAVARFVTDDPGEREAQARALAYERFQAEHDVDDLAGFCALVSEALSIADDPCHRPFGDDD
jgi:hypothetical protein